MVLNTTDSIVWKSVQFLEKKPFCKKNLPPTISFFPMQRASDDLKSNSLASSSNFPGGCVDCLEVSLMSSSFGINLVEKILTRILAFECNFWIEGARDCNKDQVEIFT